MKKFLLMMMVLGGLTCGMVSCSSDDNSDGTEQTNGDFNYSLSLLYCKWRVVAIDLITEGSMIDVTTADMEQMFEPTYATFKNDGTYYGEGAMGDGNGTYTAKGNTINCYYAGELFASYEVVSLTGTTCDLKVKPATAINGRTSFKIRCKKQ